ncbi:TolC family protein [Pedobacter rhizosphaerae]|uniref:Efflux transporter, outer membrane factor (OMF) lipoprotein, NodT family n=1 Tax=Pedobacter rhizosphaerae TaxID=390241 RepID=A0A1H9QS42_9SPHI|nr:TolC family protein [Pedobacter rhizosphaerae]SER62543.1 efflux transporter, outer membrane factor (OMF) lipoprotein, NodT family [Pedobacter rhizosphaerae]
MNLYKRISLFCYPVVLLVLIIQSCGSVKQTSLPSLKKLPDSFNAVRTEAQSLNWEELFTQQELKALIDSALVNNLDLKSGLQRILMAGANLKLSRSQLLPALNLGLSAGVDRFGNYTMNGVGNYDTNFSERLSADQKIPNPTPDYFMGFRSSWEIDIWGKLSQRKQAAYNRYLASTKGLQWFKTQLICQVAELYYELIALEKRQEILQRNIKLQQKGLEIIEAQLVGGRATSLAVSQFRAQKLATEGKQFQIRQAIIRIENQINLIRGQYEGAVARDTSAMNKALPNQLYTGIPSSVLLSRPDIQEAELQLKATKADVSAARKAFFPSLNLNGYVGYNAFKLPLLFSPSSLAAGFLGGLSAPLLNRAALKNTYKLANSAQLSAFYNYQKKIIKGYQEVSAQLSAIENYKKAYQYKTREVKELSNAVANANDLYLAGYASYLEVIVAQASVLNAEMEQVDIKQASYTALIGLFRALGG